MAFRKFMVYKGAEIAFTKVQFKVVSDKLLWRHGEMACNLKEYGGLK